MMPLVSIVVAAYNHSRYVEEMLHSCIAQTYQNIELLFIDDESTDDTYKKALGLHEVCQSRFSNVKFLKRKNAGFGQTLSELFQGAQGKYVIVIASDDKFTPDAIERQVSFLEQYPDCALVSGINFIIDAQSRSCYWDKNKRNVYSKVDAEYVSFSDYLQKKTGIKPDSPQYGSYESLLQANHIPNGYMIRKSIFEKTGYYTPEAPQEDYWLMLQISKYARLAHIDHPTFYYRWHGANSVSRRAAMRRKNAMTMAYEEKLLRDSGDTTRLDTFLRVTHKQKTLLRLPKLLRLYKTDNRRSKKIMLDVAGHSLTLYEKSYL